MSAKVLIVDDTADQRYLLRARLEPLSFQVWEADGLTSAIAQLQTQTFQLVICDYMMPGGSGLEVLSYLEAHPEFDVHFILFTHALSSLSSKDRERTVVIDKGNFPELLEAIEFLGVS